MISAHTIKKCLCGALAFATLCALLLQESYAAEQCKRKTAGFYLQYPDETSGANLRQNLQTMPLSLTGSSGDPERGQQILANAMKGDCLTCHQVRSLTSVSAQGSIGPSLDGVANKYNDGQLRQIVVNPKLYFVNTMMPTYYNTDNAPASVLTSGEVEDLVAYLKTLK